MTLGQEFHDFGYQLDAEIECLVKTEVYLLFRKNCIDGITANEEILKHYIERSVGYVTALNPVPGYEKAAELAKEALQTNCNPIRKFVTKAFPGGDC